jgi:CheY-like chemotaxis protein
VVAISGHAGSGDAQAARTAGVNHYFVKPVSPAKLAQMLASLAL